MSIMFERQEETSCCGLTCAQCRSFGRECEGCKSQEGKACWVIESPFDRCPIYQCCVVDKQHDICLQCGEYPCRHYTLTADPSADQAAAMGGMPV